MNSDSQKLVTIILPMYNEGEHIAENLMFMVKALGTLPYSWELLVIDDGSTDNSRQRAEEALRGIESARVISYQPNIGRGHAMRVGFQTARGKYIVTTESDLSWGADIIPRLIQPLLDKEADAVIASPYIHGGGLVNIPFKRRFFSRYGNKILTFGLPPNITMTSGMTRSYRKELIDSIILGMDGKEIHLEILSKLITIGAKIKEIPGTITWRKGEEWLKRRKRRHRTANLIMSHLYFSFTESPLHFTGLLGLTFMALGVMGILAIVILKITGFGLLRIPYFPHYVFMSMIIGLLIFIFSLISSQIRDIQRELVRMYAQLKKREKDNGR